MDISALILAGGRSTRMGEDKALIPWDGIPLLTRVSQVATQCCEQVYILTPWAEKYQKIVPEKCQFITETHPGQGPLLGLAEGLEKISSEWVLLLGCDLPLLQSKILQNWMENLTQIPDEILAVVPHQQARWEPLCAFYRRSALPNLQEFIQQGGNSFQKWLAQTKVATIPVSQACQEMLWNCNTPIDLEKNTKF
ncbi:molybdenum cofactor guanylyltransferase [Floridanema aerugineum]|uniref:Probable molybdenum cofactor guanylyltransferase n=1 Tax=Floridaenema aerugineum BLCC-F46 TaxID=3153654 RepID=A0ABV4X133_9CYAN